jgi:hypothetical protein
MRIEQEQHIARWQIAQATRRVHKDKPSYVYLHTIEETEQPHYVGIGYTIDRPWDMISRNDKHAKKGVRVAIIMDDSCPEINVDENIAAFWEIAWIKALKDAGYELSNISKGGWGPHIDFTDEMREKMSIERKGTPQPQLHTQEAREIAIKKMKITKKIQGLPSHLMTPEVLEKRGKTHSENKKGKTVPHLNTDEVIEKRAATLSLRTKGKPKPALRTPEAMLAQKLSRKKNNKRDKIIFLAWYYSNVRDKYFWGS